jgi:hypothetical protein
MTRNLENMTIDELVDRFAEIGIAPMSCLHRSGKFPARSESFPAETHMEFFAIILKININFRQILDIMAKNNKYSLRAGNPPRRLV